MNITAFIYTLMVVNKIKEMKKVRWGVVGPGVIAHQFAHDIKYTSNSTIIAVASNNIERAKSFASTYDIPNVYNSYNDLFLDENVDMVYVATTHNFHYENCKAAIELGKGVLCEKPITDNFLDAKKLFDIANNNGVYLMEAMWTYFLPAIKKAKEWVLEGRIGKVINIKSNFGYRNEYDPKSRLFNPELSGGCLLDMGIYTVAMAWLFLKEDPTKYNVHVTKAPSGVDYDVNMQLIYTDAVANLHSSFQAKLNNHSYIIGEKGYIDIPDFWKASDCYLFEEEKIIDHFKDERKGMGFEFEIEAAADDYRKGKLTSDIMPPEYSLKLQQHMAEITKRF